MTDKSKTLIGSMGFSKRIKTVLRSGINTEYGKVCVKYAEDLTQLSAVNLLRSRNLGYLSLHEIVCKLDKLGLHLKDGTSVEEIEEELYKPTKSRRDLLLTKKLSDFKLYLNNNEIPYRPGNGYIQALQVYDKGWKVIYKSSSEYLTVSEKLIPLVKRFIEETEGPLPSEVKELGATGEFPDGKINENDEGELKMAVGHKGELVFIDFGKPVKWIGMNPSEALQLAKMITEHAERAFFER